MARRYSLQTEVIVSLLFVVVTANGILAGLLLKTHEARMAQLRPLAARALVAEATAPVALLDVPGQAWWTLGPDGHSRAKGDHGASPDQETLALGREAHERDAALLLAGPPWKPIVFAAPLPQDGDVVVTRLPAAASPLVLIALLAGDVAVFTVLGGYLLRRRVVLPMRRLSAAARSIADGALDARLVVEGGVESAQVAIAFNEMAGALEGRTRDIEKAVSDLRESNRHLREARAGLDRTERLAVVGQLAAGVAHEVGNPMGAVLAFLDLVRRDETVSDSSQEYLGKAAREGERIRVILRQLLDYSSPPRGVRVPVDLAALCTETTALLRAQSRYEGIAIEVVSEGEPPAALADPGAVSQILLNLLLNAANALRSDAERGAEAGPADPRIRVTIRPAEITRRRDDDREPSVRRSAPDAVECWVEDNGPGIPDEDRERIFDPFFTSRPPGEGTGLGLSNASRLALEFGGSVTLDAESAREGARFVLKLPSPPPAGVATGNVRGTG